MNDVIFKIVFGKQENQTILRALLNAILGLSGRDRIVDLTILNPYCPCCRHLSKNGCTS